MSKKRKRSTDDKPAGDEETTNKVALPERPEPAELSAEDELLIEQPTRYADDQPPLAGPPLAEPVDDAVAELDGDELTRNVRLESDAIRELDEDEETRTRDHAPISAFEAEAELPLEARFDFGGVTGQVGSVATDEDVEMGLDMPLSMDEPPDPGSADAASPRLQSIVESLLFAADRPLGLRQLADLVEEPEVERIRAAVLAVEQSWRERGVQLHEVAGGFQFRTNPENASWVQKLLQQKPVRLSRALLETLAIVSYRQPITRPEIDEIRGVDSGGTLKTLMDRTLVRILGKKEEVGRPLLYGTTKEFLEFFSLRDLKDLPTLREYHELSEEHQAQVAALEGAAPEGSIVPDGEADDEPAETLPRLSRLEITQPKEDAEELAEIDRLIRTAGASISTDSDLPGAESEGAGTEGIVEAETHRTTRFKAVSVADTEEVSDKADFDDERQHTRTFGDPLPAAPDTTNDDEQGEFEAEESTRIRSDGLEAELLDGRDPDKEPI
ncbi:MAG: SMC-Scp complex subunit ScpB [Polyangia bacterium]